MNDQITTWKVPRRIENAALAFARAVKNDCDTSEIIELAKLLVEFTDKYMSELERRAEYALKIAEDALNCTPRPIVRSGAFSFTILQEPDADSKATGQQKCQKR